MNLKIYFLIGIGMHCTVANSQEISIDHHKELQSSMIHYMEALDTKLYAELDSIKDNSDNNLENTEEDIAIYRRLKSISSTIPLAYNSQVKSYIDKYVSQNYRPYMSRLRGLSQHYFGIYDKIFEERGLPIEIKYLSLVESSLNPHLVSSAGAVGPWQFIYGTAKIYDLDMNSHVDERKDAYAASYAVTKYLSESYAQFNDWLLALASYNCGRGCVQRAIQRSGLNNPTFWELSPYLPKETRNYIPKYIAMTYVMEMADFYDIYPVETELDVAHKEVMVDRAVSLKDIAAATRMSLEQIKGYNPSYKRDVVIGTANDPKRILLPQSGQINDSLLYVALNRGTTIEADQIATDNRSYKVKRGETVFSVARKFGVSVQNIRAWNNLTVKSPVVGRTLTVSQSVDTRIADRVEKVKVNKPRSTVVYYTVRAGDSLDRIAGKYKGLTSSKLRADNNLKSNLIKPGMKLKINRI